MSGPVISFEGPFPFPFRPIDDDDVDDLRKFLEIDEAVIALARRELLSASGFLTRQQLQQLLERVIEDSNSAAVVYRVIRWIERLRRPDGSIDRAFQLLRGLENDDDGRVFSDEQIGVLQSRISTLLSSAPGLQLQSKAESLSDATGQRLKRIRLICDLRPIFDSERQEIKGVIPLTTLSAICEGVNGFPVGFEAILSEQDVANLHEMVKRAMQKLTALRRLADQTNLSIPSVDLTERPTTTDDN